jgi:hypothetical protein
VTNTQRPPHDDPSIWGRPGGDSAPTRPVVSSPPDQPEAPPATPTEEFSPAYGQPAQPQYYPAASPDFSPHDQPPSQDVDAPVKSKRRLLGDPASVILVAVIVAALGTAGLVGAELYARHRADNVVAAATECVVQDKVSVSFGLTPFLLQHVIGDYGDISIHTAGNQIRSAKGMRADIKINDVNLHGTAESKGTIGALDATVTWPSEGIKETVQDTTPFVGGLVNSVTTDAGDGTVRFEGALGLGAVTVKPQIAGHGLSLKVVKVTAMGVTLPSETAQSALNLFASTLVSDFPLGIHADSVQVTNDGVTAHFSTRNALIPVARTNPCFAGL